MSSDQEITEGVPPAEEGHGVEMQLDIGGDIEADGNNPEATKAAEKEQPPSVVDNLQEAIAAEEEQEQPPVAPAYILPLIVVSQFAGTSLWFAGNAVLPDLIDDWGDEVNISDSARGYLTSVVQLGFILGTLISALTNIADRFRPTQVFLWSSLTGAVLNALIPFWKSMVGLVLFRLGTGICLAGIYPIGMKVAADWYPAGGLGRALGFLVGALAVGSALPFLLNQLPQAWQALLWQTSGLAALGGLAVGCLVPEGPFRKPGTKMDPTVVWTLFEDKHFRAAALGYFSHMWELYSGWTWCPVIWKAYLATPQGSAVSWDASAITFCVVAIGGLGCVLGGLVSVKHGSALVAFCSLLISGSLCLLSPALYLAPPVVMLLAYLLWGLTVVADSPQFSSLVASTAPAANKGTALTIVNCIGFAITIGSIQLLAVPLSEQYKFLLLAPGPVFGLWSMRVHVFGGVAKDGASTGRGEAAATIDSASSKAEPEAVKDEKGDIEKTGEPKEESNNAAEDDIA